MVPSALVIDDSANASATTWLVTPTSVTETVQGSWSAPTTFDTTPFTGLVINAGTGGATFNVHGTAATIPLTINSQAADTVNLGNGTDGVQDILGDVTLNNPTHLTTVSLDDSADTLARSVSITSASVTGLAPANIFFPHNPGLPMTILGGSGGDQFDVQSTAAGSTTRLVTQQAANIATLGQDGSMQGIQGNLDLDPNGPSWSAVMVDDSADQAPRAVTITATSITGLAPALISYAGVSSLTVDGASGGTQFTVLSTAVGTATRLVTQQADNTATVGQNGSVQGILGSLDLDPSGPSWSAVMLDDSADPALRTVTITGTAITGLAPGVITYAGVSHLTLEGSSGGTQFNVQSTAAGTATRLVTQQAANTATVGQNGSVQGILANLDLDPTGPNWSAVMLDDWADATARAVTITNTSITGLAPGVITYAGVSNMTVNGGSGGNTFSVSSLPPAGTSIRLNGGGGTNTLDYLEYVGDVTVDLPLGTATGFAGGISNIQNVTGSRGNDLIVGDANANVLVGGTGRNIIIGGGGPDEITGGGGDNVLIAGTTVWDTNPTALTAIMDAWTDPSLGFHQRVHALREGIVADGHTYALNKETVMADPSPVTLIGGGGRNWYFIAKDDTVNNGAGPGPEDLVTHLKVPGSHRDWGDCYFDG